MRRLLEKDAFKRIADALASRSYITTKSVVGSTHDFYHYPARFSPAVAREIIQSLSEPSDWVLDPFMGGGTAVVEGLLLARRMIGVDKNALAHFVASVRTRPLSSTDEEALRRWSEACAEDMRRGANVRWIERPSVKNLPESVKTFVAGALSREDELPFPRQRAFARCALLRIGQWALDCRKFKAPSRSDLAQQLPTIVGDMLRGLRAFVEDCGRAGYQKHEITSARLLHHGDATELHRLSVFRDRRIKPKLVFTSPPYPGVHVLYHRWQYRGRKETPAPYWIASVPDGYGASFYTGGSRTPTGLNNYFAMIQAAFRSVATVIDEHTVVAQLVGFSDADQQLPRYLQAMSEAGFDEVPLGQRRLVRSVPNRKWYAEIQGELEAASEILLLHRLRP